MSNLTDLLPAGAGGKQVSFVASGTIGNGVTVGLNSDGTVEAIAAVAQSAGSPVVFYSAFTDLVSSTFDSANNKVVVAYRDGVGAQNGSAVVGTVSGNAISFGSAVVFKSGILTNISTAFDSNSNKVVIAYQDATDNNYGKAIVGTVSGTSISFGSAVTFNPASTEKVSITFDSGANKIVIAYQDEGNSDYGTAIVGTVSGTSISFGSEVVFESASTTYTAATFDSNANKVVIAYRDGGNSNYGTAIVGTVSGTSISFGAAAVFESASTTYIAATFDSTNNKVVILYRDEGNADSGTAVVGTVSGTSISFGTPEVFNGDSSYYAAVYDPTAKKIVISYRDDAGSGYGTMISATVSGTSISFETKLVYENASTSYNSATLDTSNNKVVTAYKDIGNSSYGTAAVLTVGSSNNTSFIGISDAAISDTASGSVTIKGGISTNVTGLTPNSTYYVQDDGTLNTATSVANYDIASASYTQAFSVSAQVTFPSGVAFNPTGTKMFVVDNTGDDVNEYTLSTGFDVSTASFVDSFSVNAQQAAPMSVAFNTDGTKMYIVGETEDTVAQYALSTGFDVSSASFTQAFSIASQETEAQGITFNTDGTKMFIVGDTGNDINEYTLSSGFDVSTASFVDSFSLASQTTQPKEGVFNADGTELYVLGRSPRKVFKYTLTVGFDISTASYANVEFSVDSQETSPQGLAFSADGSKMYVCGDTGDDINQYATSATVTNSTTVLAGKALSSTSINLDYTT